jgi:hypothetical protein
MGKWAAKKKKEADSTFVLPAIRTLKTLVTTKEEAASPGVLSMRACIVKLDEEKSKHASLAQQNCTD